MRTNAWEKLSKEENLISCSLLTPQEVNRCVKLLYANRKSQEGGKRRGSWIISRKLSYFGTKLSCKSRKQLISHLSLIFISWHDQKVWPLIFLCLFLNENVYFFLKYSLEESLIFIWLSFAVNNFGEYAKKLFKEKIPCFVIIIILNNDRAFYKF